MITDRFEPAARRCLRLAHALAGGEPVGMEHLRAALATPQSEERSAGRIVPTTDTRDIFARAWLLARGEGRATIGYAELCSAVAERDALALGVDLLRLRRVRQRIRRERGGQLHMRRPGYGI
ncbi:MAG: hypothetical protein U0841_31005 [Chloroflexia bacterium]